MTSLNFIHAHRVTYAECTVGNHVYYARYLDILEAARGEFFRFLKFPMNDLQQRDIIFPATECHLQYLGPARYDDRLDIAVCLRSLRRVSLTFGYRIVSENGSVILEGATSHACTNTAEKPKRIPEDLDAALRPYLVPTLK